MSELGASRPSNMLCHAEQALLTTTALGWWSLLAYPKLWDQALNGIARHPPHQAGMGREDLVHRHQAHPEPQHQNLGIKRCSWRNQLYPLVIKRGNGKSLTCGKTYKTSEHGAINLSECWRFTTLSFEEYTVFVASLDFVHLSQLVTSVTSDVARRCCFRSMPTSTCKSREYENAFFELDKDGSGTIEAGRLVPWIPMVAMATTTGYCWTTTV